VGSARAAVIIASTASASTARGRRWVRWETRSSSLSQGSRVRTPWRVSQRVNPRRVESIRATVASLQRRLAVITASTKRSVLRSDRDRCASADATSSRASTSARPWSAEVSSWPQRARSAFRARSLWPLVACSDDSIARLAVSHVSANSANGSAAAAGVGEWWMRGSGTSGLYRRVRRYSPISAMTTVSQAMQVPN